MMCSTRRIAVLQRNESIRLRILGGNRAANYFVSYSSLVSQHAVAFDDVSLVTTGPT